MDYSRASACGPRGIQRRASTSTQRSSPVSARWMAGNAYEQHASMFAVNAPHRAQEEDGVVRAIAIVLAITGALAFSAIDAPEPAQAGRLVSTPYGCDPSGGPYPGYAGPYAYAAYHYGYPPDCGGLSISFPVYFPAYYTYRNSGPRYFYNWYHGWHRHQ